MYLLRTLGELSLTRTDGTGADPGLSGSKALLVLAWLATQPSRSARREAVAEFLWPGTERARALSALRQALFYLSQHADDALEKEDETLRLAPDRIRVDLWEFDEAIRREDYARALELHRGPFAAGVERKVGAEVEHWIEAENSRLQVALEVAYTRRIAAAVAQGNAEEAARLARAFAADNPVDDARQVTLIRTLKAVGDGVGALRAFETYRRLVQQELGDEVPDELSDTMERLRAELTAVEMAPPAPAPREVTEAGPPRLRGLRRDLTLGAVGIVALVLLVVAVGLGLGSRPAPAPSFLAGVDGRLLVLLDGPGGRELGELTLRAGVLSVRAADPGVPNALPAPGGRMVAYTEQAPSGWNVAVRSGRSDARTVTRLDGDEFPVAWSPDARFLLVAHRRLLQDGRTESHALHLVDLATDSLRRLSTLESRELPTAAWSPDGTQIAFTADVGGNPDVFVVDFDGANLRNLSRHPSPDRQPSWAPDRSRLTFVSARGEDVNVFTVRPDGSDLREFTQLTGDEGSSLWLSPSVMVFLAGGAEAELWAMDVAAGRAYRVGAAEGVRRLVAVSGAPPPWVDQVRIAPRLRVGSPGQHVAFTVEALDASGAPVPVARLPLRWLVVDPGVAAIGDDGALTFRATGATGLRVSAGGWRDDSLRLLALPLEATAPPVLFEEDWTQGLRPDRWRRFGEPAPATRPDGGWRGGGVLLNNGDAFFGSGVAGEEAFPLDDGLTVEVEGRMRFTGKLHQVFSVALVPGTPSDSLLEAGQAPAVAALRIQGPSGDAPEETAVLTASGRHLLPTPDRVRFWNRYALQVLRDGTVQLVVNERLYWQSPTPLSRHDLGRARVVLGSQSLDTEIAHGPLRVYRGAKYRLPVLEPAPAPR